MVETFKVGDTVSTSLAGLAKGTIAFGPFRNTPNGDERYMVQAENGTAHSVVARDIRPFAPFTVGDQLTTKSGRAVTVEAGPFTGLSGRQFYVVKDDQRGNSSWTSVAGLTQRPTVLFERLSRTMEDMAAAAAGASVQRFYRFRGRTFDLKAEYTDRQGDVWKFNGRTDRDGMPLMDCPLHLSFKDWRLNAVLDSYGPLSRA